MRLEKGDGRSARMARSDFETLFAAQMTGINRNNGRLRVSLSFATKRQFRSKMPISQQLRNAFCSCEINVTVLRSGTRVPKSLSQLRNTLRNRTFGAKSGFSSSQCVSQLRNGCSCAAKWHSCAKLAFAAAKILVETSKVLRNGLATKCSFRRSFLQSAKSRRALFFLCFHSVFAPISIRFFFLSISLQFLPPGIIQKD